MPTKQQLKASLASYQRALAKAEDHIQANRRAQNARDTANINQGLIPVEMLKAVEFVEANGVKKARVSILDARVLAKLREVNRPATLEAILDGATIRGLSVSGLGNQLFTDKIGVGGIVSTWAPGGVVN